MRTGSIEIVGKKYLMCFSTMVIKWIEEEYDTNFDKALTDMYDEASAGKFDKLFTILSMMIRAGDLYANAMHIENTGSLSKEELYILTSPDDYQKMFESLIYSVNNGEKRNIEAETDKGKKQKASQKS